MRIVIRIVLCLVCVGVAAHFFVNQPIQKHDDSDSLIVSRKGSSGQVLSTEYSSGKKLNKTENIGYGMAILVLGNALVFQLTKRESE